MKHLRFFAVYFVACFVGTMLVAFACTGQQRAIARDVLDVIEIVCAPTDDRGSCLDKLVSMRARETAAMGSASAAGPVMTPPPPDASTGPVSPAPGGSR